MKTLGKIAGGIGLLLTLTSVLTLFVTSGSVVAFAVKLGLGVALLILWGATNRDSVANVFSRMFFYSSSVLMAVLFVALLFALNFIVARRAPTWDLTTKRLFSLAPQTTQALADLKEPIKAITFIPGPPVEPVEQLFKRYSAESDKFTFEFKDPRKTPDLVARYKLREGQPATVLIKGAGEAATHTLVNIGKLADPALGEQELTTGIIKLNTTGSQKLYFTTGHQEWPLEPTDEERQNPQEQQRNLSALKRILEDEGYAPEGLNLTEKGSIPSDASALVIAGARAKFTDLEKKLLDTYLEQGGRLLYFAEQGVEADLDELLAKYGVQVDPGVVADEKMNAGQPYIVVSPFLGESPIVKALKAQRANFIFASSRALTLLKTGIAPGVTATPLALTGPNAWVEGQMAEVPVLDPGEKTGQLVLAAQVTRDTSNAAGKRNDESRVIVMGDSDILIGAFGYDPNRNLVLNSIAWATQQANRITIRPPDRDVSTIDIDEQSFANIRLITMDLVPTILIGLGLTIARTRRAR